VGDEEDGIDVADPLADLIASLGRGSVVHIRGDFVVPAGDYRVVALCGDYVKLQKGAASPVKLTRDQLLKLVDSGQRFSAGEGVLGSAGYRVGQDGLPRDKRRELLAALFSRPLRALPQVENVSEWGEPRTPKRYWKMVRCLQAFTENARGRKTMRRAVNDWEADLEWLDGVHGKAYRVNPFE